MAKLAKHFTVTKHLPDQLGSIEFSGIVYKNDPENYDIEDVRFSTTVKKQIVTEDITQFFHMFRQTTDPEFHHNDIIELLTEWLRNPDANTLIDEAIERYNFIGVNNSGFSSLYKIAQA